MPYTDGGERIDTPSVPYQPVPLETGDMKPPLMPGARLAAEPPPKVVLPPAPETIDCPCPSCMATKEAVEAERELWTKRVEHELSARDHEITRLRQLVDTLSINAEAEREQCAKLCDHLTATFTGSGNGERILPYQLDLYARSIRARG